MEAEREGIAIGLSTETEGDDDAEETDDAEPEDDFNAAWEVLDLARAIYNKQAEKDPDDEVKLKLADIYIALGDVSLETGILHSHSYPTVLIVFAEKFDQAITDYSAGLALKKELLPPSSRQIAEAHYKLSMVLDLTPGRLADAIDHVEMALASVETRLAELRDALNGRIHAKKHETVKDTNDKVNAFGGRLVRDGSVHDMTKSQIESEITELEGLKDDLALKVSWDVLLDPSFC